MTSGFFYLSFFFFFPCLISAVANWMYMPHFHTWYGLSTSFRCRSETCCMRLAKNTGRKISPKINHLGSIAQLCRAISSQLRHVSTIEKISLNDNISPQVLQYGELRPTSGKSSTRMWANAQPDGRPAEHRWRPLFNAAKFG